jgi:hypothetical protein
MTQLELRYVDKKSNVWKLLCEFRATEATSLYIFAGCQSINLRESDSTVEKNIRIEEIPTIWSVQYAPSKFINMSLLRIYSSSPHAQYNGAPFMHCRETFSFRT